MAIAIMACMSVGAQDYFEGVVTARSFEKHSKLTIKFSQGTLMNGARDAKLYVKENKMAVVDDYTNITTIYDPSKGKVFFVFNNINQVIDMPTQNMLNNMSGALVPQPTDTYIDVLGMKCRLYEASKDGEESGAKIKQNIQILICEELGVHPDLAPYVSQSTGLPYLGVKYVVDTNTSVPPLVQMNSFIAYDVQDVQRVAVDDSIFVVPADYKVVDSADTKKMLGVYKANAKAMKKLKKEKPNEEVAEIKFDINEDWDF